MDTPLSYDSIACMFIVITLFLILEHASSSQEHKKKSPSPRKRRMGKRAYIA